MRVTSVAGCRASWPSLKQARSRPKSYFFNSIRQEPTARKRFWIFGGTGRETEPGPSYFFRAGDNVGGCLFATGRRLGRATLWIEQVADIIHQ